MYLTDRAGRVLANLSQPRSVPELARLIAADAHAPFSGTVSLAQITNEVKAQLDELVKAGYAKSVGFADSAADAVTAVSADDELPDLHPEKAEQYQDRLAGKDAWKLREGELYYFTAAGLEALTA